MKNITNIDYSTASKILQVKDLRVNFKTDSGLVYAVRGVSFDLYKGETLCIVGESGSGKSVTSKTIMGILAPNAIIASGQVIYNGEDLVRVSEEEFHRIRGHKIGMIFQDPLSSLNPIMKVGSQITEATLINRNVLKRRFNELISKELVALRNEEANLIYETDKGNQEIVQLKNYIKDLNEAVKIDNKNENVEQINATLAKIKSYFVNLKSSNVINISGFKDRIEAIKKEQINLAIEENKIAKDMRIKNIEVIISLLNKINEIEYSDGAVRDLINERVNFIKNYINVLKRQYKEIKPILNKALKEAKIIAKSDNKKYYKDLKDELDKNLFEVNKELKVVTDKIVDYIEHKLTNEELNNYKIMLEQHKKYNKQNETLTGIARASVKEKIITSTGNKEFDELLKKRDEIVNLTLKYKSDFTNKTKITKKEAKRIALNVMEEVGIPLPEKRFKQYPFEFSGGMRQRIVIAIALTANPDILICDEPTTALDVTIQAQILELINKLKYERGLSCIFITHDLGVVANMADRVAVMYAGKIVEYGLSTEVFFDPKHPYTWALLSSIPDIDSKEKLESIPGTPPDMRFPIEGDAFAFRSKYAMAIDFKHEPPYFKVSETHYAATWLLHKDAPKVEMPKIVSTRIQNALKGGENNGKE